MKKTSKRAEPAKAVAKSSSSASSKNVTDKSNRVAAYQQYFKPLADPVDSAGFIQQVNGYGTPVYSQVSSFAGV